jgi:UDP-N-acetylglucosamine 2-epimerase (non-hydrolysing)
MTRPLVASVFGTRPEAIKMAPVVRALAADAELEHELIITAQHRDLLDDVLALFELAPAADLDLMRERQRLEDFTALALKQLAERFAERRPDFVLVHGDTTTTFAAALAAFYAGIPAGHVEAGLRTSTVRQPFPEEFNRRAADLIAAHYYCPTAAAAANLKQRDYGGRSFITGNTALDSARLMLDPGYAFADARLAQFAAQAGPKLVLTAHRREHWGEPLREICRGLLAALAALPDARVCVCLHPNPAVREIVAPLLAEHPQALLIAAPRYDAFINLLARTDLVLTDSGGIQEEVTVLGKYALVLREETERPEAVAAGYARVVGTGSEAIQRAVLDALPQCRAGVLPGNRPSPFGDGQAAGRIHRAVRFLLGLDSAPPADYAG